MSAFYRVTSRAIIRDKQSRVLVLQRKKDAKYEIPGGGWEYAESFEECLRREVREELGVELLEIGDLWFTYRGRSKRWGSWALRLVVNAQLKGRDFRLGPTMAAARFVSREEFLALDWVDVDAGVCDCVDVLWPAVEKKRENR